MRWTTPCGEATWDLPATRVLQWWVVDCKDAKEHAAVVLFAELWNEFVEPMTDVEALLKERGLMKVPDPPRWFAETVALNRGLVSDPAAPFGSRRRSFVGVDEVPRVSPRYRGYADAAEALRRLVSGRG